MMNQAMTPRRARILCFQTSASGGGSKRSLLEQVKVLQADPAFEIEIISTVDGWFSEACSAEGIPYTKYDGLRRLPLLNAHLLRHHPFRFLLDLLSLAPGILGLWHLIWKLRPDAIILNESRDLPCILPFCFGWMIIIQNSMIENETSTIHGWLAVKAADHVFCVAEPVIDGIVWAKARTSLHLVPLIVDFSPAPAQPVSIRKELGLSSNAPLVGMVGAIHPRKGQRDLVEAFLLISGRCDAQVVIAGSITTSNPEAEKYQAEIRSLLADHREAARVHFLGWREDIPCWLEEVSLLVMPSYMEGMPRACVEALMSGVPVLAYDIPSIAAIVDNGRNGRLVPVGDLGALSAALEELLGDQARLEGMSREARKSWRERFQPNILKERTRQAFHSVLNHTKQ